jgi:predicted kinase
MLVVMAGLPGTGKSELARGLGRQLGVPVFSVDPIESAMLRAGIKQSFETGLAAYFVTETLADAQLRLGLDAIVDAVNAEEPAKQVWRQLAIAHGLKPRIIECCCTDERLHRVRLRQRQRGLGPLPEPTWEDVERRRLAYTAWSEPVFSVDSASPLEDNLARTVEWLRGENAAVANEYLLYPSPKDVTVLPRSEVMPFILARLTEQEGRPVPDLDRVMGLGQLARRLRVEGIEAALAHWLESHPTANGHDAVGLFLMGYWPTQPRVSTPLVNALLHSLATFSFNEGARESAVFALRIAHDLHRDDAALQGRIRDAFRALLPMKRVLQDGVQEALIHVLGR